MTNKEIYNKLKNVPIEKRQKRIVQIAAIMSNAIKSSKLKITAIKYNIAIVQASFNFGQLADCLFKNIK